MERTIRILCTNGAVTLDKIKWIRDVMRIDDLTIKSIKDKYFIEFSQDNPEFDGAIDLIAKVLFGGFVPETVTLRSDYQMDRIVDFISMDCTHPLIIIQEFVTVLDTMRNKRHYLDGSECDQTYNIIIEVCGRSFAWDPMCVSDELIAGMILILESGDK